MMVHYIPPLGHSRAILLCATSAVLCLKGKAWGGDFEETEILSQVELPDITHSYFALMAISDRVPRYLGKPSDRKKNTDESATCIAAISLFLS
ncbi:hypothetical protein LOAG_12031 [Loa loa]|uniref:Secreted protein n=1 Tax=Loa loa TaxID=7209 RepID=A0A1S0TLY3_LOALO|nr:hypothetical protein LOAG_12031 [Loa loa]EFO16476.1 hypothetical protein LOAG_12031 [Loa loa]